MNRYDAILVTHTHWDREWYLPVEEYRFRLVQVFDDLTKILADEPDYHSFWLDGQTVPLEDLATVCPERMEAVGRLIRAGKLCIGPRYILADQWLVSGEACVRNLLIGRGMMADHGQDTKVGYVPDNFGHMDQLPQILLGFGIDNAVFWRGYRLEDIDAAETTWSGIDGSKVCAYCLVCGYSNARGVTEDLDESADRIDLHLPALKAYSGSGKLLLMNGIDHALPTPRIGGVIAQLEKRFPELNIRHGSIAEFLDGIREEHGKHRPLNGELHHVPGLDGCLSNRPEQKRMNRRLENHLAHYAEPLAVMAGTASGSIPPGLFERAWKLLIKCHPHDSISGCHADSVAADPCHAARHAC